MQEKQTIDPSTIREFIVETFLFGDSAGLDDNTSFMETGLVDSMGILKITDFIELTYGIRLQPDEFVPENLDSIDNIVNYIKRSLGAEAVA